MIFAHRLLHVWIMFWILPLGKLSIGYALYITHILIRDEIVLWVVFREYNNFQVKFIKHTLLIGKKSYHFRDYWNTRNLISCTQWYITTALLPFTIYFIPAITMKYTMNGVMQTYIQWLILRLNFWKNHYFTPLLQNGMPWQKKITAK